MQETLIRQSGNQEYRDNWDNIFKDKSCHSCGNECNCNQFGKLDHTRACKCGSYSEE